MKFCCVLLQVCLATYCLGAVGREAPGLSNDGDQRVVGGKELAKQDGPAGPGNNLTVSPPGSVARQFGRQRGGGRSRSAKDADPENFPGHDNFPGAIQGGSPGWWLVIQNAFFLGDAIQVIPNKSGG